MKEFEYTTVRRNLNELDPTEFVNELNELGKEGWDIVCKLKHDLHSYEHILLKRAKFKIIYLDE